MSASLGYNKIRIKDSSVKATIPNNDVARLMYYLKSVSTVLKYNGFAKYTNYNNYNNLSNREVNEVIQLATIFNPVILMKAKVFIPKEDLDMDNRFFEITDESLNIHAIRQIVIGGITTKVLKIMVFKFNWLNNNYFFPLKRLTQKRDEEEDEDLRSCTIF